MSKHQRWWPSSSGQEAAVIIAAILVRILANAALPQNMLDDRDNYLGLAAGIANGDGFRNEFTGEPTAFRPPLYPIVMAALQSIGVPRGIGVLHAVLGGITTWLVMRAARAMGIGSVAILAGLLVAFDPILVQYSTFPMTESLCALLSALLLAIVATSNKETGETDSFVRQFAIGVVFGLCTLARPTYWIFGLFAAGAWTYRALRKNGTATRFPVAIAIGVTVTVTPWVVRNAVVMGRPIVMTTHGGYTLLLGNNAFFYSEEVDKPWGTLWEDAPPVRSQAEWYQQTLASMHAELGEKPEEVAVDRWMSRRAMEQIRETPGLFLRACLLRFTRFWSVVPQRPARGGLHPFVLWGTGAFYASVVVGLIAGLVSLQNGKMSRGWWCAVLLAAAFTVAHLVYWSNARMRAPVIPAIAVIATLGWQTIGRCFLGVRSREIKASLQDRNS